MISGSAEPILNATVGYALLGLFGLAWIGLGILWGRKATTYEGYAVAGRNVGLAMGAATAVATWITSNTTMLAPQFALQLGIWGMLAYSTASFGLFAFAPMAKRIRSLMPAGFTAVEFVRRRYGRPGGILFLLISLFYALTWLVSMAMAGGKLLEVLSGIPYAHGLTVVMAVCGGDDGRRGRVRAVHVVWRDVRRDRNRLHPEHHHRDRPDRGFGCGAAACGCSRNSRVAESRAAAVALGDVPRSDYGDLQQHAIWIWRNLS